MAHVELTMQAVGVEAEKCNGCDRQFCRSERMSAVVDEDGEPYGWFCDKCIKEWNETPGLRKVG